MWFETEFETTSEWITSGYSNLTYNAPPAPWAWKADIYNNTKPERLSLTPDAREGNYALKVNIASADYRNEPNLQGDVGTTPARFGIEFGQEYWMGWSVKIVDLANEGSFQILGQIRGYSNDSGNTAGKTNFYTLQANSAGGLTFGFSTDPDQALATPSGCAVCGQQYYTTYLDGQPIQYVLGDWFDIVLHFKLDWDGDGFLEAWHNGKQFVNIQSGPTVYRYDANGLEVKPYMTQTVGIYTGGGGTGEVHYDSYRLWKGGGRYEDVSPLGLSPGQQEPQVPSDPIARRNILIQSSLMIQN